MPENSRKELLMEKKTEELSPFFRDFDRYFGVVTVVSWYSDCEYEVRSKAIIDDNPFGWHLVLKEMGYSYPADDDVDYDEELFFSHLNDELFVRHWDDFESTSFGQTLVAALKKYIPIGD